MLTDAQSALISRDVTQAKGLYDTALAAARSASGKTLDTAPQEVSAAEAKAAFGAAFTRLILLYESQPSKAIAAAFGQAEPSVARLIGADGCLMRRIQGVPNTRAVDFVPFVEQKGRQIFGKIVAGTTIQKFQDDAKGFIPLVQEIAPLLATASSSPDLAFSVPKELLFAARDIPVNQIDALALLAVVNFAEAGLQLLEPWSFPLTLSGIFDSSGKFIGNKANLVSQMNEFFTLRADHQMSIVQMIITSGLNEVLLMRSTLTTATQDGVLDNDANTQAMYAEIEQTAKALQQSLVNGSTAVPYLSPATMMDLSLFFADPPNGNETSLGDPFVLQGGAIEFVESYFTKLLEGVLAVDFDHLNTPHFRSLYQVINHWKKTGLADELGGLKLGKVAP
jgi:hypothetical protein